MTIPAVTVVSFVAEMEQVVVLMGVLRVSSVVAVAALVVDVVLVPVVAVVVLLCTLPLVRLVLPSISHAQWVAIRRCTVGELMVVAEVACLVQPSMVAD